MYSIEPSVSEVLSLVARLCLGVYFLTSAVGKLSDQPRFIEGAVAYQVLPERLARAFAIVLPWIELVVSLALIFGLYLLASGLLTLVLLACFLVAVVINLRRGRKIDCNCHGIAGSRSIGWGIVSRDVLLSALAMGLAVFNPQSLQVNNPFGTNSADYSLLASTNSLLPIVLLLAFCFVVIALVEWTLDIHFLIRDL